MISRKCIKAALSAVLLVSSLSLQSVNVNREVLTVGTGAQPQVGQQVTIHYIGRYEDGTPISNTYHNGAPYTYRAGNGTLIAGFDAGVLQMRVGERARLTIPCELAYGPKGVPGVVRRNAAMIFEVELLSIA